MESRPDYIPASSIDFFLPSRDSEPSIAFVIFDEMDMAAICYSILTEHFSNGDLYLNFYEIGDNEIEFQIRKTENKQWVSAAKVSYKKDEFEKFIKELGENIPFAVLFGKYDKDNMRLVASPHQNNKDGIIVFSGYKQESLPRF
jgi:hypothetical protein